ncbi:antibiotic biosynthesis monooxygenase family protein [Oceanobacillus kapialis]|uniref:Antibiotic biosynthesis monooxygenase family protein n=1 Tax=Oceanobacillus kapialis TaxID=481353 RepID=A0ABW5PYU9_9BACI
MNIALQYLEGEESLFLSNKGNKVYIDEKEYEIIDESGALKEDAIHVFNYVSVNPASRERFEKRFLNRPKLIEKEKGFLSIRVLRPLTDNTFLILTQWETVKAFQDWQGSKAYQHAHKKRGTKEGLDQEKGVLSEKPYHLLFKTKK